MPSARRTATLCLLLLFPFVGGAAAQEESGNDYDIFIQPDGLFTGATVVIETDIRLGQQNRGAERRIKNEVERLLREWGRYELVDDVEDADLKITLVTSDQVSFFEGIYEQLKPLAEFSQLLFVIASPDDEVLMWAEGTSGSLRGRTVVGNQRAGWDNEGARRIARHFVQALRARVEPDE